MQKTICYTVADEEPNCMRCDNVNADQSICDKCTYWENYRRTERVNIQENAGKEKRLHRCCFTGHRPEKLKRSEEEVKTFLKKEIQKSILNGYSTFITGMARGVDLWAAEIVLEFRELGLPVKLIAAIPYQKFEERWSNEWKSLYNSILHSADLVRYISEKYSEGCLAKRNQWMVDHSSKLIAVYDNVPGGTLQTIRYAENSSVSVVKM